MFDFFSFGRKTPDDPLSTMKAVTKWMKELPLGDVFAAHEKVVKALLEFNEQNGPFTPDRLEVLLHLDSQSREMQHVLCQQYLRNPRMSKVMESRLWNAIRAYYWEVTRGYHAFIMDYVSNRGASKIKTEMPQVTARAIHNFARLFKWHAFRYEKVEERLWRRLHNLYHFAEFEQFQHEFITLYNGEGLATTCSNEFVHALMLDTVNTGSFYPKQIELLDVWLVQWSLKMHLGTQYQADQHIYFVNLQEGHGARRVRNADDQTNCRYWGTSKLITHIEEIRAKLMNGELPARLGLTEDCRLPGCLDFLDDVARMWAPKVQRIQRKHERSRMKKMIEVVHGMPEICAEVKTDREHANPERQAAQVTYEEMMDVKLYGFVTQRTKDKLANGKTTALEQKRPVQERWVMENESESGYGATLDEVANDWVRLGKLVGLKPERTTHWRIGVVRRLNKVATGLYYVGIEVLVDAPVMVMLRPHQIKPNSGYVVNGVDSVNVILPFAGLYKSSPSELNPQGEVFMDSAEYAKGRMIELKANNKAYVVRLGEINERGDDWLSCGLEVVSSPD